MSERCKCCGDQHADGEDRDLACPRRGHFVFCDKSCKALVHPDTVEGMRDSLIHYRDHELFGGCSHGC